MSVTVEKCLQAWTNSIRQMNTKADIVFFGDSLIYYGEFSSLFPGRVVCNLGLRGDTLQGMIDRVEQVRILKPDIVFVMGGINNLKDCTISQFEEYYYILLDSIKRAVPSSRIVVYSLLPVNDVDFSISCSNKDIIEFNKNIKNVASEAEIEYYDLFSLYYLNVTQQNPFTVDGIHLHSYAYEKWYNCAKSFV